MKKTATFRFYAELNDFLTPSQRQVTFTHEFKQNPAIKDIIEALGVPHSEIDLILVNGESKDFTYQLQDQDHVAIYPVFEAMDISPLIHLRAKPLRKIQFILDVHLGKLARYLRLLGFDTFYERHYSDAQIIQYAVENHCIILTRDVGLLKNKKVTHGLWVRATDPNLQIQEIIARLNLSHQMNPFTRCLKCNGLLIRVEKFSIQEKLQPKTQRYYSEFSTCKQCGKIYWGGSHYIRMQKFVDRLKESVRTNH